MTGMAERTPETRLALLEQADEHHKERLLKQESTLERLVAGFEKLLVLEERHMETKEAQTRIFKTLKDHTDQIGAINNSLPQLIESRKWMVGGILAIVSVVGITALKVVLIPQQPIYHPEPPAKVSGP